MKFLLKKKKNILVGIIFLFLYFKVHFLEDITMKITIYMVNFVH